MFHRFQLSPLNQLAEIYKPCVVDFYDFDLAYLMVDIKKKHLTEIEINYSLLVIYPKYIMKINKTCTCTTFARGRVFGLSCHREAQEMYVLQTKGFIVSILNYNHGK